MKPLIDPINTDDGQFHGRNNETGELATVVTPVYMNDTQDATRSTQREVISILTAAGIKPAEATNDQLLTALKALFLAEDDTRVSGALQKDKNLADLTDATKAKEALALDKVGNWMAVQANGGTHSDGNHHFYIDWDGKIHFTVDSTYVGEAFTTQNPPTPEQSNSYPKTGGEVDGEVWSRVGNNYRIVADASRGVFWRFDGSNMYLMFTNDGDPHGGYNGLRPLIADFATGKLSTGHDFTAGGTLYAGAGACWMATDGNVNGPVWGGWLNNYIAGQIGAVNNNIAAQINDVRNWVYQNFVNSSRQASAQWAAERVGGGAGLQVPAGCVMIGARNNGSSNVANMGVLYAAEQILVNGQWVTIGLA